MPIATAAEQRVLVLAGRDTAAACRILRRAGLAFEACPGASRFLSELARGAAVAVLAEPCARAILPTLAEWVKAQPGWSDLPFLLLAAGHGHDQAAPIARRLRHVTVLAAPVRTEQLASTVGGLWRARQLQYEARAALARVRAEGARAGFALQAAGLGWWTLRLNGFRFETSPLCRQMLGHAADAAASYEDLVATVAEADRPGLWGIVQEALGRREPFRLQYYATLPDASRRWLQIDGQAFFDEGGVAREVTGILTDMSARQVAELELRRSETRLRTRELEAQVEREVRAREEAQAQLAQAQKLEALGQLAGGIAHDFNNVLQAVAGGLDLIAKRADDPAMVRKLARMSAAAAERGASVTGRLLSFARRGTLKGVSIPVDEVLEEMREMLAHALGPEYRVSIAMEAGLCLLADRGQLETVLLNLSLNARDAMPHGGPIRLIAEAWPAEGEPDAGSYVRLRVADSGSGMSAATLARAAEPFFTTKPPGKGTGLGLAMAQGFAAQSGGGFDIHSTPERGTVVSLWFPRTSRATEPAVPMREAVAAGIRLLVVDDDAIVREVLAAALAGAGYEVDQAPDGLAALARIETGPELALLLTDLTMPGMNGDALIEEARRRRPALPVLLLTGYAERKQQERDRPSGAGILVLTKPVSSRVLLEAVQSLLRPAMAGTEAASA